MSVFTIIKRSRKAKEELRKQEQKKAEPPKTKYWHVPTHAASDALLGAPSGWVKDDAHRIREQNRRRSAIDMASRTSRPSTSRSVLSPMHGGMVHSYSAHNISGSGSSTASGSRTPSQLPGRSNSGLSTMSYPAGPTNAVVQMSHSYNNMDAALYSHTPSSGSSRLGSDPASPAHPSAERQIDFGADYVPPVPPVPSTLSPPSAASHHTRSYGSKGASYSSTRSSSYTSNASNTSNASCKTSVSAHTDGLEMFTLSTSAKGKERA